MFIAGCASSQGKTTVTAGLARYHARAGRRVRVFKTGPDFIDPMFLSAAAGTPVYNLDCWMVGVDASRALLSAAASEADLILVEGSMGLYDGEPSGADLAATFGLPVAAVIDASAMAQTFGAIAKGLKSYRDIPFAGVIANRVAGTGHAHMLAGSLPPDIPLLACLGRTTRPFPERHLGLTQAGELGELPAMLDELADLVAQGGCTDLPPPVQFAQCRIEEPPRSLSGRRVAIARDAAFSFTYRANLDCLEAMGAELLYFSPLSDEAIPAADALYLPGGYPELHAARLAGNQRWLESVRSHAALSKPLYAECGGMMALFDSLETVDGGIHAMAGLLAGKISMQTRLATIGLQSLQVPKGELRGHSFHYSRLESGLKPAWTSVPHRYGSSEGMYRQGSVVASYLHLYFPSNPAAVAVFFAGIQ